MIIEEKDEKMWGVVYHMGGIELKVGLLIFSLFIIIILFEDIIIIKIIHFFGGAEIILVCI